MSANTVTVAASAVSATNTASLAATMTITAASIRAAASIAASALRNEVISGTRKSRMQSACIHPMVYIWRTIWNGTIVYHMYHIYREYTLGKYINNEKWYR